VEPNQPAEKAGIKQGDVIVRVNGKEITPEQTLSYIVANVAPGTRIPVELIRDGKRQTVNVTVAARPPEEQLAQFDPSDQDGGQGDDGDDATTAPSAALGVSVTPLTPPIARTIGVDPSIGGLVIAGVNPSSDAAGKGLQRGDVIVSANQQPVRTAAELGKIVAAAKAAGRKQVVLYIQRKNIGNFFPIGIAGN
jgi:serine protease Do